MYIANPEKAIRNLMRAVKDELYDLYTLEVIDVLKNPKLTQEDKIVAAPALVLVLPPPVRKMTGDLSDKEKVLLGLGLTAKDKE